MRTTVLLFLIAVCITLHGVHSLTVISPESIKEMSGHIPSPTRNLYIGPQHGFQVNGSVIFYSESLCIDEEDPLPGTASYIKGNIVAFGSMGCSQETQARFLVRAGAIAGIFNDPAAPGSAAHARDGSDVSGVHIPIVCVHVSDFRYVRDAVDSGHAVQLSVSPDPNPWLKIQDALWFILLFRVGFASFTASTSILALYVWRKFVIIQNGFKLSLPQVTLILEIIANAERAVYCALDPFWSNGVLTRAVDTIMFSVSAPISISATILVATYWKLLVDHHHVKLTDRSWFFFYRTSTMTMIVLLLVIELITGFLRARYYPVHSLSVITGAAYAIFQFIVAMVFLRYGVRLLSEMRSGAKMRIRTYKNALGGYQSSTPGSSSNTSSDLNSISELHVGPASTIDSSPGSNPKTPLLTISEASPKASALPRASSFSGTTTSVKKSTAMGILNTSPKRNNEDISSVEAARLAQYTQSFDEIPDPFLDSSASTPHKLSVPTVTSSSSSAILASIHANAKNDLRKMTVWILGSTFFMLVFVVGAGMCASTYIWYPEGYFCVVFFLTIGISGTSFTQVVSFLLSTKSADRRRREKMEFHRQVSPKGSFSIGESASKVPKWMQSLLRRRSSSSKASTPSSGYRRPFFSEMFRTPTEPKGLSPRTSVSEAFAFRAFEDSATT